MPDGFHFTEFCSKCQKFFCDCSKRLGRAIITAGLMVSLSHMAPSFIVPPEWNTGHPHTEQQQDTRQPREFINTSGATASVVTYRGILSPKQAPAGFHAEHMSRTGEVVILQIDANGIRITSPQG
jgi:hypothetical protein